MIVAPTFTGDLLGKPLRFFKAPRLGIRLPWHAIDDLHRCLSLPRDLCRHYRQQLQRDHSHDVETVATDGGIEIIAPHWMAQGVIQAFEETGLTSSETFVAYSIQVGQAWKETAADLPHDDFVERLAEAFRNDIRDSTA